MIRISSGAAARAKYLSSSCFYGLAFVRVHLVLNSNVYRCTQAFITIRPCLREFVHPSNHSINHDHSMIIYSFVMSSSMPPAMHPCVYHHIRPPTARSFILYIYICIYIYIYIYIAIDIYTYIYIYVYIYVPLMLSCVSISRSWAAMRVNRVQIEFCISRVKLGLGTNLKHLEYFLTYTS